MTTNSIGIWLRRIRERAGISQDAAAHAVGIDSAELDVYEAGERDIPNAITSSLARLYRVSADELSDHEVPPWDSEESHRELDIGATLLRAAPSPLGERAREGIRFLEARLSKYVELAHRMAVPLPGSGHSPFPPTQSPVFAARQLRRELGLGMGGLGDLFRALSDRVLVWRIPLGTDPLTSPSGLSYNHREAGFCIAVNADLPPGLQIFALAHELAHVYCHGQHAQAIVSTLDADQGRELFADAFADALLIPSEELIRAVNMLTPFGGPTNPIVLLHLQQRFGVGLSTLVVRLLEERLVSHQQYSSLLGLCLDDLAAALGYHVPSDQRHEKLNPLESHPVRVLLLVRSALERGIITDDEATEIIGSSTDEVRWLGIRPTLSHASAPSIATIAQEEAPAQQSALTGDGITARS